MNANEAARFSSNTSSQATSSSSSSSVSNVISMTMSQAGLSSNVATTSSLPSNSNSMVQMPPKTSNRHVLSSVAPPLPPRRLHKDSGGCLLANSGSNAHPSGTLPPPPPIPSHTHESSTLVSRICEESNTSVTVPFISHSRRDKTDNIHSSLHGPLPLPPVDLETGKCFFGLLVLYFGDRYKK